MGVSRMIRGIVMIGIILPVLASSSAPALAAEEGLLSVSELLVSPAEFQGTEITVEGELVGDYGFRRDGYMWTQLNDDPYARHAIVDGGAQAGGNIGIGVRMPAALGENLDPAGGYRLEGPVVRLTGLWRFHDPDRGGESYLDVTRVDVVEEGRRLEEGPDWLVFWSAVVLLLVSLSMWWRRRDGAKMS